MNFNLFHPETCELRRYAGQMPLRMVNATRCHIFSASSSSSSNPETEQTASTSGASSPSIGVSGSNNASVNLGTSLTLSGNSQVQTFDPQVAESAFNAIVTLVQNALSSVTTATTTSQTNTANETAAQNSLLSSVLSQDQATAANVASGGQTNNNNTMVEIAIAALIAFVIWAIWGKK